MPSNRSKNAARKGSSKARSKTAPQSRDLTLTDAQRDIAGVVLAVVAVAMFVSVVVPSGAVVTSAVGHALTLSFGAGAVLVPIALFLFATTFFMGEDGPFSGHVAAGLALIVFAALAMISLNQPGVGNNPELALSVDLVSGAGGFVGGFAAFWLIKLVGVVVGNVLLIGVIASGVVVCGFSISGAVSRVGERVDSIREGAAARREERLAEREEARTAASAQQRVRLATVPEKPLQQSLFDETG